MKMPYRISYSGGGTLFSLMQIQGTQTFKIPISRHVLSVLFDPYNEVLNKGSFLTKTDPSAIKPLKQNWSSVYPNPFSDRLMVSTSLKPGSTFIVNIYDIRGALVHTERSAQPELEIGTGDLDPGLYLVKTRNSYGDVSTTRVLKL